MHATTLYLDTGFGSYTLCSMLYRRSHHRKVFIDSINESTNLVDYGNLIADREMAALVRLELALNAGTLICWSEVSEGLEHSLLLLVKSLL